MLIEDLVKLGRILEETAEDIAPEHHKKTPLEVVIDLTLDGDLKAVLLFDRKDKETPHIYVPYKKRSGGTNPLLLADKASYALGQENLNPSKAEPVALEDSVIEDPPAPLDDLEEEKTPPPTRHEAFLALIEDIAQNTTCATTQAHLKAIQSFYANAEAVSEVVAKQNDKAWSKDPLIAFSVDGQVTSALPAVRRYWAQIMNASVLEDCTLGWCAVCAKEKPILRLHKSALPTLNGTAGAALISMGRTSFQSYGQKDSTGSQVCIECESLYALSLRQIFRDRDKTFIQLGEHHYAFWVDHAVLPTDWLNATSEEDIVQLFRDVYAGKTSEGRDLGCEQVYCLCLTNNARRFVVRSYDRMTVASFIANMSRWLNLIHLPDQKPDPFWTFSKSLVHLAASKVPPTYQQDLAQTAFFGKPLSARLIQAALTRVSATRLSIVDPKGKQQQRVLMRILKAYLMENTGAIDMQDPNYILGQLLAHLDKIHRWAIPSIKEGVGTTRFKAMMVSPQRTLPTLLEHSQKAHLSKLRKINEKRASFAEKKLVSLMAQLPEIPLTLTKQGQAAFALGYWQAKQFKPSVQDASGEVSGDASGEVSGDASEDASGEVSLEEVELEGVELEGGEGADIRAEDQDLSSVILPDKATQASLGF